MAEFEPVNGLEAGMSAALAAGDQERYLRLLADAELILPVSAQVSVPSGVPAWATVVKDGQTFVAAYTSHAAMVASTTGQFELGRTMTFRQLVAEWPDPTWALVVDAGLPLAANLPASLIRQIAGGEFGAPAAPDTRAEMTDPGATQPQVAAVRAAPAARPQPTISEEHQDDVVPTVMQKVIPPGQVCFYLDKGYDWVAGYVHRWQEAAELETVSDIVSNLGLVYPGSPFLATDDSVYVLRWTAYLSELYRVPLGGTDEAALRAVPDGWVIERPPFTGNGHVPHSRLPIREYKIDSIRLPHRAEMWRIGADGGHHFVAIYDADEQRWLVNEELVGVRDA
jgi:hypothetical protein